MNWLILITAGCFEIGFTTCLAKANETSGAVSATWLTGFFVCLFMIMFLLYKVIQTLPLGTTYAV